MRMGGQCHASAALPVGKRPGTYCTGGEGGAGPVWTHAVGVVFRWFIPVVRAYKYIGKWVCT